MLISPSLDRKSVKKYEEFSSKINGCPKIDYVLNDVCLIDTPNIHTVYDACKSETKNKIKCGKWLVLLTRKLAKFYTTRITFRKF